MYTRTPAPHPLTHPHKATAESCQSSEQNLARCCFSERKCLRNSACSSCIFPGPYSCFPHHPEQPVAGKRLFFCARPGLSIFLSYSYLSNWCHWSCLCWSCCVVGMSTIINLLLQQSFDIEPKRKHTELSTFRRKEEKKRHFLIYKQM